MVDRSGSEVYPPGRLAMKPDVASEGVLISLSGEEAISELDCALLSGTILSLGDSTMTSS